VGLHCDIGSQDADPAGYGEAIRRIIAVMAGEPEVSSAVGDERRKKEIEDLVHRALDGDKDAARQVDGILDGIDPNQLQPHTVSNNPGATVPPVPLEPDQAEVISQMHAQMSGKSLDDLVKLKNALGEHGDIIGDSMQVMSDPDVEVPVGRG
jgi:hypothetical protein